MKWYWILLAFIFIALQYRLWVGEGSMAEVWGLRSKITVQKAENNRLRERNNVLKAEVADLKKGLEAVEERARMDLGMIKEGETFYQLVDKPEPDTPDRQQR